MLIIDSLLKFNFFLSGEVQETSLFFGSVTHKQQSLRSDGNLG